MHMKMSLKKKSDGDSNSLEKLVAFFYQTFFVIAYGHTPNRQTVEDESPPMCIDYNRKTTMDQYLIFT